MLITQLLLLKLMSYIPLRNYFYFACRHDSLNLQFVISLAKGFLFYLLLLVGFMPAMLVAVLACSLANLSMELKQHAEWIT